MVLERMKQITTWQSFNLIDEIADTAKPTRKHHQAFKNNEKPVVTRRPDAIVRCDYTRLSNQSTTSTFLTDKEIPTMKTCTICKGSIAYPEIQGKTHFVCDGRVPARKTRPIHPRHDRVTVIC
jgi:hypothetical protein